MYVCMYVCVCMYVSQTRRQPRCLGRKDCRNLPVLPMGPTTVSKETYYSVKRDLLQCQKSVSPCVALALNARENGGCEYRYRCDR
jgi:hypothetical protein